MTGSNLSGHAAQRNMLIIHCTADVLTKSFKVLHVHTLYGTVDGYERQPSKTQYGCVKRTMAIAKVLPAVTQQATRTAQKKDFQ